MGVAPRSAQVAAPVQHQYHYRRHTRGHSESNCEHGTSPLGGLLEGPLRSHKTGGSVSVLLFRSHITRKERQNEGLSQTFSGRLVDRTSKANS